MAPAWSPQQSCHLPSHECLEAAAGGSAQLPGPHLRPHLRQSLPGGRSPSRGPSPLPSSPTPSSSAPPQDPSVGHGRNHHGGPCSQSCWSSPGSLSPSGGKGGLSVQWRGWHVPGAPGFVSAEAQQAGLGQRTPLRACAGLPLPGDPPRGPARTCARAPTAPRPSGKYLLFMIRTRGSSSCFKPGRCPQADPLPSLSPSLAEKLGVSSFFRARAGGSATVLLSASRPRFWAERGERELGPPPPCARTPGRTS